MILLESGTRNARSFSSIVQFARQLSDTGVSVAIDEASAPETMDRTQKYEAARFLTDVDPDTVEHLLITGAQEIDGDVLENIHSWRFQPDTKATGIGSFDTAQSLIGAQSKLAYALGREPEMLDLNSLQVNPLLKASHAPLIFNTPSGIATGPKPWVLIYVPKKLLKRHHWLSHLEMLASRPGFSCHVVTEARGKDRIKRSKFNSTPVFSYGELAPDTLARMADIAVFYGDNIPGERMASLAVELWGKGGALVDCTTRAAFASGGTPTIRGAADIAGLDGFLQSSVLPNLAQIRIEVQSNARLQAHSAKRLLTDLGIERPKARQPKRAPRTLFVPTNGVGLGHAQRCALIAEAMDNRKQTGFAAFPSCLPMLQDRGFDCQALVSKSDKHIDPFANDLLTYLRLSQSVRSQDHLVFDGGYIFDGIYRTILENHLSATWIRRGLWQPGQLEQTPLERERAFHQVIVPQEAFEELNTDYSFGSHIHKVGPIVRRSKQTNAAKATLRNTLVQQFGRDFEKLVVTLLGGGVAADRGAQLQSLAAQFSNRPDCLHLIVVWPNARVSANLFGWENTYVVRTKRALELCQASDFVVSAAGYNTYHELLYHAIPAIFIPQMARYMDDQERRAKAASDRGLAVTVSANELLSLRQKVSGFLDGNRAKEIMDRLKAATLPEPGTVDAANLIKGASQ